MTDTPRTDKHVGDIGADGLADGDFARTLERENAAMRAVLEGMEVRNIEQLVGQSPDFCRAVGQEIKRQIVMRPASLAEMMLGVNSRGAANPPTSEVNGQ